MTSPRSSPERYAPPSAEISVTTGSEYPAAMMYMNENTNADSMLNSGPAASTTIRFHGFCAENGRARLSVTASSSDGTASSSSPVNAQ